MRILWLDIKANFAKTHDIQIHLPDQCRQQLHDIQLQHWGSIQLFLCQASFLPEVMKFKTFESQKDLWRTYVSCENEGHKKRDNLTTLWKISWKSILKKNVSCSFEQNIGYFIGLTETNFYLGFAWSIAFFYF